MHKVFHVNAERVLRLSAAAPRGPDGTAAVFLVRERP